MERLEGQDPPSQGQLHVIQIAVKLRGIHLGAQEEGRE